LPKPNHAAAYRATIILWLRSRPAARTGYMYTPLGRRAAATVGAPDDTEWSLAALAAHQFKVPARYVPTPRSKSRCKPIYSR
jgi:hypothetical protein